MFGAPRRCVGPDCGPGGPYSCCWEVPIVGGALAQQRGGADAPAGDDASSSSSSASCPPPASLGALVFALELQPPPLPLPDAVAAATPPSRGGGAALPPPAPLVLRTGIVGYRSAVVGARAPLARRALYRAQMATHDYVMRRFHRTARVQLRMLRPENELPAPPPLGRRSAPPADDETDAYRLYSFEREEEFVCL